jgi:predicted  nucleic acid-binding Zn-ribbon protein
MISALFNFCLQSLRGSHKVRGRLQLQKPRESIMADIVCGHCQNTNPANLTFCKVCGWRLVKQPPPSPPADTSVDPASVQLQAAHQQLQDEHAKLAANLQQLQDQHQKVVSQLTESQQRQQIIEDQKQQAEGKIQALMAEAAALKERLDTHPANAAEVKGFIAELQEKLQKAEQDLQVATVKIKQITDSPVVVLTRPLWMKLVSWGLLPLIGSAGGFAIGAYKLNPYKPQLNKTLSDEGKQQRQLTSIQSDLAAAKQQLEQKQQELVSEQQKNIQINSALSDSQKSAQATATQLSTTKSDLTNAKAEIVKARASIADKEQQLQTARTENQQLTVKAAQATALQEIINRHPYVNYKGLTEGRVTVNYSAKNDKNDKGVHIIEIDHLRSTGGTDSDLAIGSISGNAFPAVPLIVEPISKNTAIVSPPGPANGWQKVKISVQGKGSSPVVLKWSVP